MSNSSTDIRHWDQIADTYAQMSGTSDDFIYHQFKTILWDSLGEVRDLAVLDLGCGHGWLSEYLVEKGASVWGVDGSDRLLNKARQ